MKNSQADGRICRKMDRQACRQTNRQTENRQIDVQKDSEMSGQTDRQKCMGEIQTHRKMEKQQIEKEQSNVKTDIWTDRQKEERTNRG